MVTGIDVLHMRPCSILNNLLDCSTAYAILIRQFLLRIFSRNIFAANFKHLFFRKLCNIMRTPAAQKPRMPSFVHHVFYIVGLCTHKQVSGVATRAVVAVMTYLHSRGNGSIGKYPSYPVRMSGLFAEPEISSASTFDTAKPIPTLIGLTYGYLRPKSVFYGAMKTFARTIDLALGICKKFFSTCRTNFIHSDVIMAWKGEKCKSA